MITVKSKVKDICANDEAYEIVHELNPGFDRDDPRLHEADNMSLKALLAFPATKCPKDLQKKIAEALEEAEIED